MKWVAVTFLLMVIQYGCGQESARTEGTGVSLTVGTDSIDDVSEPGFYVEVSNQSTRTVVLYEEVLLPYLLVHVYDQTGNEAIKGFPPMPERPEARQAIALMAGKSYRQTFDLRDVVQTKILERGKYTLEAIYDATGLPTDATILKGPVRSNKIEFSFP